MVVGTSQFAISIRLSIFLSGLLGSVIRLTTLVRQEQLSTIAEFTYGGLFGVREDKVDIKK